ncbi:glucoamylase family protein [Clostridium sp.]|uniref:GH36-type glycosyl hydrolase domain-containing protein n=1 Tax=Clostridium sp. TaxID=1506 RepID=UPI0025BF3224|nr:glucoamylase family protein [Clostridium sp.]
MKKETVNNIRKTVLMELNDAFKGILHNHRYLNKLVKQGEDAIPSAEWLLDNIYLIEKEYKTIKHNLPHSYFDNLPNIEIDDFSYPRIYNLAKDYIELNNNVVNEEECVRFINNQEEDYTIGELWAFPLMLRIALIINLALIVNDMVVLQKQRLGAKRLANLVIENYEKNNLDWILRKLEERYPLINNEESNEGEIENNYFGDSETLHDGLFSPEFIDKFFTILRDNSIEDERVYNFALRRLKGNKNSSFDKEIIKEHIREGAIATSIGSNINSLRVMDSINWNRFFNETSKAEKLLMEDPSGIYNEMDFETKDYYRHKVEEISRKTAISEVDIIKTALELSSLHLEDKEIFKDHIGYYLVDDGLEELLKRFDINKNINKKLSQGGYIAFIFLGTIAVDLLILLLNYFIPLSFSLSQYIFAFILMLVPSSEVVIALFNWFIAKITKVSFIPKMDYSNGVPNEDKTIVVIPAILSNSRDVTNLMKKLEVYYLGNRDNNIYFALLGDLSDSYNEIEAEDKVINEEGIRLANDLNNKYSKYGNRFFFLNRKRQFNKSENVYMGHERKRGKLMEFMALIKGDKNTSYNVISSDISNLIDSKYIITLDSDTFLPIGSAKKLISAMSHILNKPYIEDRKVVRGYSIMQPKISVNLEDKHKTYFSKIFAGDAGVDAYSTASSDTYQDLFNEGIFTGKGIIEINSFYNLLKDEIKENKVLSHDLIEGLLTRCGLVTDIELVDGYPSSYMSSALRLHRWVRGDWQIFSYLFSSKLSSISKWKIFDNLRRSLLAPSLLIGLIATLTVFNNAIQMAVLLFLAIIIPLVFTVTDFVVTPKRKLMGSFKNLRQIILIISFIPYQAYLMLDAICRSLYRITISKKNLLQWKTSEKVESSVENTYSWYYKKMWINVLMSALILILSFFNSYEIVIVTIPIAILWALSPFIACKISKEEIIVKDRLEIEDEDFLRELSRRIFAYYEDFVNEENNYLAPDNYQEKPYKGVAYRTSPTNIGMGLISNIVAYDLGYLSIGEVIYRLELTIDGMRGLEKYKGHYLNWYDTKTKLSLWPRYVSTVDSGNLLGYLWIIKEEVKNFRNKPIIREKEISSLKDTYELIRKDDKEEFYHGLPDDIELKEYKNILMDELTKVKIKLESFNKDSDEGKEKYWFKKLEKQIETKIDFYDFIFEGIEKIVIDYLKSYKMPTLLQIIDILEDIKEASGNEFKEVLDKRIIKLKEFDERLLVLSSEIESIMEDMKFDFLYNKERGLFSIGYNVEDKSLGNSYYDLMASESRTTSFLTIARGEIPKEHWYNLNRNMSKVFGFKTLASWSGTMFEYFMPYQIMKSFDNTIWSLTYSSVLKAQMSYGDKKDVPWGISESAYYVFDINDVYQYKAFGVPGVGLKRGLDDELVVSPYSSIMTLPLDTKASLDNLKNLYDLNAYGRYGFIEAIDYSEGKEDSKEVRCYMVHHLGMSLLALDNVINNNILKERFHNIPEIKAAEILLKEKVPEYIVFDREIDVINFNKKLVEREEFIPRVFKGSKRENPEVLLLSNGVYSTMISDSGSGYSKKNDMTVYRWKGDSTSDSSGMFFYIKNLNSNDYWSATYEPCKEEKDDYLVEFTLDKARFKSTDGNISTKYEVMLSSEDNLEFRKITLKNNSKKQRTLEITSYLEVTLQSFEGDAVHPSFSNLFISTEYNEEAKALIGNRRPRAEGAITHYIFHNVVSNKNLEGDITYETSRLNFIGRNRDLKSPKVMDNDAPLQNTVGTVLDPIMSIRCRITLKPGEEGSIYYLTGVGESKEEILDLIYKYKDIPVIEKSLDAYNYSNALELKHIGIRSAQANIYQSLASYLLYLHSGRKNREAYIKNISMNQENLWAYGISGDLPIILLVIYGEEDIDLLRQTINMHYYFRNKGVKCDLVIYNEEEVSYEEPLQKDIISTINNSLEREFINKQGGVFIHNKSTMGEEVRDFLIGISRIYIDSEKGNLSKQLMEAINYDYDKYKNSKDLAPINRIKVNINESEYIKNFENKEAIKALSEDKVIIDTLDFKEENNIEVNFEDYKMDNYKDSNEKLDLDFFNGYGGFDKKDKSYVIKLKDYLNTPAPWINVISNKDFGFHISEVGSSYTWCGNSRENKITPWSNDWVSDKTGEALYIRDNSSGVYFTITPMPVRDGGEYIIKHSFGYSTFKHTAYNIQGELQVFTPNNEKLKICKVKLKNLSSNDRNLSLFYYAQLVLGVYNYGSAKYISTEKKENCIYGNNPYSKYFGKLKAYLSIQGEENQFFTGDRKSFVGIGEDLSNPKALSESNLNNRYGSIYDPCLASQLDIYLRAGEEKEVVILLGQEEEEALIEEKINKYKIIDNVYTALEEVKEYWSYFLGNIQVKTPDPSMDYLLNGWLMYQTLSCRYLSRTAFYQSGGAYGFRDQLQDSMAIGILNPSITREQILRSASRQYLEGDVQHWWHPIINSGIRTRFSDDLLWLPYVTIEYIKSTGDYSILEEKAPYLEDEPLRNGEDERYTIVNVSNKEGSIYEHCLKAIDRALKFGSHNIPLMGSGDWNDGMSTVGNKGKGESVWVGWFLYKILDGFEELCKYKDDIEKSEEYEGYKEFIKENQEKEAWDGGWYRRAYFDNGKPLGSRENDECKIDSIAQSWSVISKASREERAMEAMEAVDRYLVDKDNGLIKLLAPPFDKSSLEPGYIKGYVPGVRENGGQYTHAAVWVILALTKLGLGTKAWKYYNMINPINHSNTELEARRYKVEPYVMSADVYIKEPHGGRGGWSWYTGASGWMYKVGIEDILGLKKLEGKGYLIEPCIPNEWQEYGINIKNKLEDYNIIIKRDKEKGIFINGEKQENNLIPKDMGELQILVII